MKKRIVVTGMGCITPVGHSVEAFWKSCLEGKNGFGKITLFDASLVKSKVVAEVKAFEPEKILGRKLSRRMDKITQFAVYAAREAIRQAHIETDEETAQKLFSKRTGVSLGTGVGGIHTFEAESQMLHENGSNYVNPLCVPKWIPNMAAAHIAMDLGLHGPVQTVSTACASGIDAVGHAIYMLESERADIMLAGGAEACITPTMLAGFENMGAHTLTADAETASRPFDKNRDGFVLGEGAAVIVLETHEHALKRGASILAEIVGYGTATDAFHMTAPHPEGQYIEAAIEMAMSEAKISSDQIGYVNAHGTSTPQNDAIEAKLYSQMFGNIPVNSTKSVVGHLQGAASALETIVCVQSLLTKTIHPTLGTKCLDETFDIDLVIQKRECVQIDYALNAALGFGGHNAALIIKRYEP